MLTRTRARGSRPAVFVIRQAGAADVDAITRVINAAFQVERFFKRGDRTSTDRVRALMTKGTMLVADAGGDVIASVYTEIHDDRVYIGMVSVDPSHQREGLGRLLMQSAEAHGRARGCRVADINVVNLRTELPPFYHRLGYVETGTRAFDDDREITRPCHLVMMSKPLADT